MLRIEDDVAARGEGPSKRITNFWREMKRKNLECVGQVPALLPVGCFLFVSVCT